MANYDAIEVRMTWDGDFMIGGDDLLTSKEDQIVWLVDYCQKLMKSTLGDWRDNPRFGASLGDFVGESNTRKTSVEIKERIINAFRRDGTIAQEDLEVIMFPIGNKSIVIALVIDCDATLNNSLNPNEPLKMAFIYDYAELGPVPMASSEF